jgi:hypothetical protein
MVILIVGPYRHGTNDNPHLMLNNFRKLEAAALHLFRLGHIPVINEWVAWPIPELAKMVNSIGQPEEERLFPVARRPLSNCDAILRIGGTCNIADEYLKIAKEKGLKIYHRLEDIKETS